MQKLAFAIPLVLGLLLSSFGCNDSAAKRQATADTKAAIDAVVVEKPQVDKTAAKPKTPSEQPPPQDKVKPEKPADDKERLVERVVDYIVAYDLMGILTDELFSEKKVAKWAKHRFAAYDEPLELRAALSLVIYMNATYPTITVDEQLDESFRIIVKFRLDLEQRLGKDEKYIMNTFKVTRVVLQIEGNPKIVELVDKFEKEFNDAMTPA